jgi:hypothetical protein
MKDFGETDLQRLEALVNKSKTTGKLPAAEALELKGLKLLRDEAELAKAKAKLAAERRKLDDRDKYRIGGLALGAGLSTWSDAELKGGFAMLASATADVRATLAKKSKQATENGKPDFGALLAGQPPAPAHEPAPVNEVTEKAQDEGYGQTDLLNHTDATGGFLGGS